MRRNLKIVGLWATVVLAGVWAGAPGGSQNAWGQADPGELFPNVKPYDETVDSPVTKQEKVITKVRPVEPEPAKTVVKPEPVPQETPKATVKVPENVIVPEKTIPSETPARRSIVSWAPYGETLKKPFLNAAEQASFDKSFADIIAKALAGSVDDKRKAAADLATAANDADITPGLKRYVLLHAVGLSIRGGAKLEDRSAKAHAVLPMLQEPTLAVAQARADCLTELLTSAPDEATDKLMDMVIESRAQLAKFQVQAGFYHDAEETIHKAHEAVRSGKGKSPARLDQMAEAEAWLNRATMAASRAAQWQQNLKTNPNDPVTNTYMTILHLSLYGNLQHAAMFANRSDKIEIQKLAAVLAQYPTEVSGSAITDHAKNIEATLAIAGALLEVAKNTPVAFDSFSVAMLAIERLEQAQEIGEITPEQKDQAKTMCAAAAAVADKTKLKSAWTKQGSGNSEIAGAGGSTARKGDPNPVDPLFARNTDKMVKFDPPTPAENKAQLELARKKSAEYADKLGLKLTELETDHFLIYTDWNTREHAGLKKAVEEAYGIVIKAFDISSRDNVFVGKLPVYLFDSQEEFVQFAETYDHFTRAANMPGYQRRAKDTQEALLAMYRPVPGYQEDAKTKFGGTLTWLLSSAFMERYRTSQNLPTWVNGGLASTLSRAAFPKMSNDALWTAVFAGREPESIRDILEDKAIWGSRTQAISETVVAAMIKTNGKSFIKFINLLKDGSSTTDALKAAYGWNYAELEVTWRAYTRSL